MTVGPPPVCTVCIANYNGESLLIDCIDSVLHQECDFAVEIIVHDDASTDNSLELLATRYPQVKVINSLNNVGFCVSNNRMVAEAAGEFILLLNNDAALASDALRTLHAHAMNQTTQGILTLPQNDWDTGALVDRGCLLDLFYNPVPNLDPARQEVAMVIGACLWMPKELWIELGGFPDWFESIAEDMQICCRARLAGFTVEVTSGSSYRHRQGISFGGNRMENNKLRTTYHRRCLSERNKTFVLMTCTPLPDLIVLLPLHFLALFLEGLVLSAVKFEFRIFLEIYANVAISVVRKIKLLLKARKSIQGSRTESAKTYRQLFKSQPQKLIMLIKAGIPTIR